MAPKSALFLFVILAVLAVAVPIVAAAPRSPKLGGYQEIANPNTPAVAALAKYAVAEHNKEKKSALVFVSVVKFESQVVNGVNYRLTISAKDGAAAAPKTYIAVVYKSFKGDMSSLVSFNKL